MAKTISVKLVGAKKPIQSLDVLPGTTVADVLTTLDLPKSHQLSDAKNPAAVYHPTDDIFARVDDGAVLYASSLLDAGI